MSPDPKRIVEVRLIVIVLVDITAPTLTGAFTTADQKPSSLADIIASVVTTHLESLSYVEAASLSA